MKTKLHSQIFDDASFKGARMVFEAGSPTGAEGGSRYRTPEEMKAADMKQREAVRVLNKDHDENMTTVNVSIQRRKSANERMNAASEALKKLSLGARLSSKVDVGTPTVENKEQQEKNALKQTIANYEKRLTDLQVMNVDGDDVVGQMRLKMETARVERRLNIYQRLDALVQDKSIDDNLAKLVGVRPSSRPDEFRTAMKDYIKEFAAQNAPTLTADLAPNGVPTKDLFVMLYQNRSNNEEGQTIATLYNTVVKGEGTDSTERGYVATR